MSTLFWLDPTNGTKQRFQLLYYSSLKDLVLRGSLVFHCSYNNTVSVGKYANYKEKPETTSGLREYKTDIITLRQTGHWLHLRQPITQPKQCEVILKKIPDHSAYLMCVCMCVFILESVFVASSHVWWPYIWVLLLCVLDAKWLP